MPKGKLVGKIAGPLWDWLVAFDDSFPRRCLKAVEQSGSEGMQSCIRADVSNILFNVPKLKAVYDHQEKEIRLAGCEPEVCPHCGQPTLWPPARQARNALSRFDNKTYICEPCGSAEAGRLTHDAVELAEMEKAVNES